MIDKMRGTPSQLKLRPQAVVYEIKKTATDGLEIIEQPLQGDEIPVWPQGTILRRGEVTDSNGKPCKVLHISMPDGRTFFCEMEHVEIVPMGQA